MCTWRRKYNLIIATTFERKVSARLSGWLERVSCTENIEQWLLKEVYDELNIYWNSEEFNALSEKNKKAKNSIKGGSLHTEGAMSLGTIVQKMEKTLGCPPLKMRSSDEHMYGIRR